MDNITLSKIISFSIDAIIKRTGIFVLVMIAVSLISDIKPKIGERYPATKWSTKNVYTLFFLFLIITYTLPILLGLLIYQDATSFYIMEYTWRESLIGVLFGLILFYIIWYLVTHKYQQPFSNLGFTKNKLISGLTWGCGFLLLFELMLIYIKSRHLWNIVPQEIDPLRIIGALFIGSISEEVFFRGYVYSNFRKRVGIIWGIILSSVCFAVLHQLSWIKLFIIGIILCYIYEKSGSLIASIIAHIVFNIWHIIGNSNLGIYVYTTPWPVMWIIFIITLSCFIFLKYKSLLEKKEAQLKKET